MSSILLVDSFDHIMAKAWADEAFKAALMADPKRTLEAHGIEVPKGLTLKVCENTDQVFHLVLPNAPDLGLTEETLDSAGEAARCGGCGSGGGCGCGGGGCSCNCICW